jgi:hypothetical protein
MGGPTLQVAPIATEVPLNDEASLLIAGGAAYGLKRLHQRRQG